MKFSNTALLIIITLCTAVTLTAVYAIGTVETFTAPWQLTDSSNGQVRMLVDGSGNVGIGTSPGQRLTVAGGPVGIYNSNSDTTLWIHGGGTGNRYIRLQQDGGQIYDIVNDQNGLDITNGSAILLRLTNSGNVGIGTSVPGEKLEVSGNIAADGNFTTTSSNKELKISAPPGIPICIGSGC